MTSLGLAPLVTCNAVCKYTVSCGLCVSPSNAVRQACGISSMHGKIRESIQTKKQYILQGPEVSAIRISTQARYVLNMASLSCCHSAFTNRWSAVDMHRTCTAFATLALTDQLVGAADTLIAAIASGSSCVLSRSDAWLPGRRCRQRRSALTKGSVLG